MLDWLTRFWRQFSILPVPGTASEDDGGLYFDLASSGEYNHIALCSFSAKDACQQLTEGEWEVVQFAAFNAASNRLYYFSTEVSPLERHLYSLDISGCNGVPGGCTAIKTRLTEKEGWFSASFDSSASYYFMTHSGPGVPQQHIYSTSDTGADIVRFLIQI